MKFVGTFHIFLTTLGEGRFAREILRLIDDTVDYYFGEYWHAIIAAVRTIRFFCVQPADAKFSLHPWVVRKKVVEGDNSSDSSM